MGTHNDPDGIVISACSNADVQGLASAASREGVNLKNTQRTFWFRAMAGPEIVGTCAYLVTSAGVARLKGAYVRPTHRKRGIYVALLKACIASARTGGCRIIEGYTSIMALSAMGFQHVGDRDNRTHMTPIWRKVYRD